LDNHFGGCQFLLDTDVFFYYSLLAVIDALFFQHVSRGITTGSSIVKIAQGDASSCLNRLFLIIRKVLIFPLRKGVKTMRISVLLVTLLIAVAFIAASAFAVPPGKTVEFPDGDAGKVIFDGKTHSEKGLKCNDCHTKIFPMKKGGTFTMAEMNEGKACGACHNGEKAFSTKDEADCGKCHKK